jgi:single-strand DNA-binding protein
VTTWTRLAEVCGECLKKGHGVRVVGRLKQDRWTDADGKTHSRVHIVAEHVEFKPQFKKDKGADAEREEKADGVDEQEVTAGAARY